MSRKNQAILWAWLETIFTAFWDGAASAGAGDISIRAVGVELDLATQFKVMAIMAVMNGLVSARRKLQQSPLPHFDFGVEGRLETVERHITAMTNTAVELPKE